jgi:hypothetical protein
MNPTNHFEYFSDIEQTFVRRRGANLFLSPKDWALIESWKERGIPLHIAISAIEDVFDGRERQREQGRISSLGYCTQAVEQRYNDWLASHVGASTEAAAAAELIPCVCGKLYCFSLHREGE